MAGSPRSTVSSSATDRSGWSPTSKGDSPALGRRAFARQPPRPSPARVRLPGASAAIGALVRGEVSLVEHIPADRVASLAANPEIKVGKFTALLAPHRARRPDPAAAQPYPPRGLSYAIDRKSLLEETLLSPSTRTTRSPTAPFPGELCRRGGRQAARLRPAAGQDAHRRRAQGARSAAIKLTLDYPAKAEAQSVVPKIVDALRLVEWRSSRSSTVRRNWKRNCGPVVASTWRISSPSSSQRMPAR